MDKVTKPETFDEYQQILTEGQKDILDKLINGKNVFITGNAGTGKSFLLDAFSCYCDEHDLGLVKTAPTGIAAQNIGGVTLHHQFGLKTTLDLEDAKELPTPVARISKSMNILLIDEISMVRIDVFDKIMQYITICNRTRNEDIQIILCGDFYQLPPVLPRNERKFLTKHYGRSVGDGYCFQSQYWQTFDIESCTLTEVIRQNDEDFCRALDQCKEGDIRCKEYLASHSSRQLMKETIWVCGKNDTANEMNQSKLKQIKEPLLCSYAEYDGDATPSDGLCDYEFKFKLGARVVILANDTKNDLYQNGSTGTITDVSDFDEDGGIGVLLDNGHHVTINKMKYSKYEYEMTKATKRKKSKLTVSETGSAEQYPMRIGYAITIHKSQGQTYDAMNLYPEIFADGQLYVALSRCKSIDKIFINGELTDKMFRTSKEVLKYYNDPKTYCYFEEKKVPMFIPQGLVPKVRKMLEEYNSKGGK